MLTDRLKSIGPPLEVPECALTEAFEAADAFYRGAKRIEDLLGFDAPEVEDLLIAYQWLEPQVPDEDVRDYWRDLVETIALYR